MTLPLDSVDPGGLLEYSVVFTDRSLNHMSAHYTAVMQETLTILSNTYGARTSVIVPGGGSFGMEAVARQFATDKKVMVLRNGQFSYRWSQIFDAGSIPAEQHVLKATLVNDDLAQGFAPMPIAQVVEAIRRIRPDVFFAPHVETAAGIVIPDSYIRDIAAAVHEVGGLFVLDCVASGALWVNMDDTDVDVILSAPQKSWSGTPGLGYVMLNERARELALNTESSSFAIDLKKWLGICEGYLAGVTGYHTSMPTDMIAHNLEAMREAVDRGLDKLEVQQVELGTRIRKVCAQYGLTSVAARGFESPTVVVLNSPFPPAQAVAKFKAAGIQIAAGVPLMVDEPKDFQAFRIGLFGLDKWADIDGTVERFEAALKQVLATP